MNTAGNRKKPGGTAKIFPGILLLACILAAGCTHPGDSRVPETTVQAPVPQSPVPASAVIPEEIPIAPSVPAAAGTTERATPAPEKTPRILDDGAMNARVQDAKNKLEIYRNSDKAGTVVSQSESCSIKQSRELGYVIDTETGEDAYISGDYGSINGSAFRQHMLRNHSYLVFHTHARDWFMCGGSGTIAQDTFSLKDLSFPYNFTADGYHIRRMILISDKTYEIYPKTPDNWKPEREVSRAVADLESRMEVKFSYTDFPGNTTYYDVDNMMPLLVKKLDYAYIVNENTIN
ncbi:MULTISPECIES: hypothetical protein [unclassified Methanoregula]|uniref:hypothetical protein n=1 Tax=unclassified Methanoregula TaxID=2649730 RepID=UPI0009CB0CE2|nr:MULTISPECIES: hypothetical protein [unclassified Methanoregula]OPX62201.1 MAG: hypothetical protein A4E33_02467 [Methanoregula sp. PtaB.Bin085]OPY35590.1 MAG: hypothetical protein A4E34_00590 [Methanoregula sp. PtaU1.Bin006]